MSHRSHRAGLVVVRIVLPCWTLLMGVLLLWVGITLNTQAPTDAWPIIILSLFIIIASGATLWWLNRRKPQDATELDSASHIAGGSDG